MVAGCAQTPGGGRRPVDEGIRRRIQGGGTRRGWGRNKRVGHCGGKVERPRAPDARNERQRRHWRSGRTERKEWRLFVRKRALSVRRQRFFCRCSSYQSLEASLSTRASRSIAGPIVFSLDRNKPLTEANYVDLQGHVVARLLTLFSIKNIVCEAAAVHLLALVRILNLIKSGKFHIPGGHI